MGYIVISVLEQLEGQFKSAPRTRIHQCLYGNNNIPRE